MREMKRSGVDFTRTTHPSSACPPKSDAADAFPRFQGTCMVTQMLGASLGASGKKVGIPSRLVCQRWIERS